MTVCQLLYICWAYEWVTVETMDEEPLCDVGEAGQVKTWPEVADRRVVTFFVGTRFVKSLNKSIPVLVIAVK